MSGGSSSKYERNKYQALTHVSDVLWHFIGPGAFEDYNPESAVTRLESYFDGSGNLVLKPHKIYGDYYERSLIFRTPGYGAGGGVTNVSSWQVKEPKAVCFCDIPVNHLPLHMLKYGDIGVGIRRELVVEGVQHDLKPVRYYPLHNEQELEREHGTLWTIDGRVVTLSPYVKIPTRLAKDLATTPEEKSELFDNIYEEREWRAMDALVIRPADIACLLIPERKFIDKRWPKLLTLARQSVSLIVAADLYRKEESTAGLDPVRRGGKP